MTAEDYEGFAMRALGAEFDVHAQTVCNIVHGKTWAHHNISQDAHHGHDPR